jgi:hypothetical protein
LWITGRFIFRPCRLLLLQGRSELLGHHYEAKESGRTSIFSRMGQYSQ